MYAEFDRISDAAITEMQQLTGARLAAVGAVLQQVDRSWSAAGAAFEAEFGPRPGG